MQLTETKKKQLSQKLLYSRFRILNDYGFYGLMLMHMSFGLEEKCPTAYTNAHKIVFGVDFLDNLNDQELDFVLMHEVLHVVLKHCFRGRNYNNMLFNIACDIVVNSNIKYSHGGDINSISLNGEPAMHLIDNEEGYLYTAEEVYNKLLSSIDKIQKDSDDSSIGGSLGTQFDNHDSWSVVETDGRYVDEWEQRIINAMSSLSIKNSSTSRGDIPAGVERLLKDLLDSSVNWRKLLADFISFEVTDYSWSPPDRRYSDTNFFMPDYNEPEEVVDINILFEVDTSGSMSDDDIVAAYSEIKGAIDFSNGRLKGWLGFYDGEAYMPTEFSTVEDVKAIKPKGGGGTCVANVFSKLNHFSNRMGALPDAIIILTDGYDEFPDESVRGNIPVFWLINNEKVTPPWGIVARFKSSK